MLCPLSSDDDDWRSVFHTLMMNNHALTVGMRRWQLTDHDSDLRHIWPCSVRCHETKTTDGACFIHGYYITMLCPLSWDDDNWRACFIHEWYTSMLWPYISSLYETCSVSYHRLMTMDRARSYIPKVWIMLHPLSSCHDNGQSMDIYHLCMEHALSVVIVFWPWSEHGNTSLGINHVLQLSSSHAYGQSMAIYP